MRQAEEQDLYIEKSLPTKKPSRFKSYTDQATQKIRTIKDKTEKLAQKRRITAAVEEARTNKYHEKKMQQDFATDEDTQRQRMSRMGEIILNYHRETDNGGERSTNNPAEAHLIQAVENDPQNPDGYERLGDFYMEKQNFEDARECYKYVLRLDPRHRRAQEAMKNLDRVLG